MHTQHIQQPQNKTIHKRKQHWDTTTQHKNKHTQNKPHKQTNNIKHKTKNTKQHKRPNNNT